MAEQSDRFGDIFSVNLFPSPLHFYAFAVGYLLDQVVPLALLNGPGDAINSTGANRGDFPVLSQGITVKQRLQGRLARSVVAGWPDWMRFIQRSVGEDFFRERHR